VFVLFIQNIVTDRHNHHWNSEDLGESLLMLRETPLHRLATAPLFGRVRAGGPRAAADDARHKRLSGRRWVLSRASYVMFVGGVQYFLAAFQLSLTTSTLVSTGWCVTQFSNDHPPLPPPAELLVSVAGKPDRNP
jgi:hypothetical protein